MPLPTHLLVAAAGWWWVSHVVPRMHHTNKRPRLLARRPLVAESILTRRHCADLLRVTTSEFKQLCELLFASLDELVGNWRFTSRERIAIALYCLSNYQPLRKAQATFGWSIASLSENIHAFVDAVIERLDDDASRWCSSHASACFFARLAQSPSAWWMSVFAAYRITGWTEAEQQAWIDDPFGPAAFHDCIGIVDATYIAVLRPKDPQLERRLYSTYKKKHAVYFVVVVDRKGTSASERCSSGKQAADVRHFLSACRRAAGFIRYCDDGNSPLGGNESVAFSRSTRDLFIRPDLYLLGDSAYAYDSRCRTGYRADNLDETKFDQEEIKRRREYNVELSSIRIRVEHTFSRVKHTFRLLEQQWPFDLHRLAPTFRACCLLANWLHRTRNLYS